MKHKLLNFEEMHEKLKNLGLPSSFCFAPYAMADLDQDGSVLTCYRGKTVIGNWKKQSLSHIFNDTAIKQIRQDLYNGVTNKNCASCKTAEKNNTSSPRLQIFNDYINDQKRDIPKYESFANLSSTHSFIKEVKENPSIGDINNINKVEVRPSNLCNLRCMHCGPHSSSKWVETLTDEMAFREFYETNGLLSNTDDDIILKFTNKQQAYDYYKNLYTINDENLQSVIEILKNTDHIVFAGGEPIMSPDHHKILKTLIQDNISQTKSLEYTSNLNIKNLDKTLNMWTKFKKIFVKISADADFTTYPYFRTHGNTQLLKDNILKLNEYIKTQDNELSFMYSITFNMFSALRWKNILQDCADYGLVLHTSIVLDHPTSIINLPQELKDKAILEMKQCIAYADKYLHTQEQVYAFTHFTQQVLNFTKDSSNKVSVLDNDVKKYILLCDRTSNNSYKDYFPELEKYM